MAKPKKETVKIDLAPPPAVETPVRTLQQIQQEFTALCTKAGHLEYQRTTLKKDVDLMQEQMRNLNFEAAALQGAEQAQRAKEQQQEKAAT